MYDIYATSSRELAMHIMERIAPMLSRNAGLPVSAGLFWEECLDLMEEAIVDGYNRQDVRLNTTSALLKVQVLRAPHLATDHQKRVFAPIKPNRFIKMPVMFHE